MNGMESQATRVVERFGTRFLTSGAIKAVKETLLGGSQLYLYEEATNIGQRGTLVVGIAPDTLAGQFGWHVENGMSNEPNRVVRIVDKGLVTYLKPQAVKALRETLLGGSEVYLVEDAARSWQKGTLTLSLHPDVVAAELGWINNRNLLGTQ
ncbi:hypothetical protein [Cupriavidus malaysiensis]|uniref:Uncharacterized protein n=1 Tax=Cupriavidus malaysiensis TaxID=367825 RepID=A0A1D9IG84_9BURK|nr:hypothetical protein [Cupriavidus malaysiensis]AOZ11104.1 hypothetical protein BKK80_34660 [Cupriavidus malaysiensis]